MHHGEWTGFEGGVGIVGVVVTHSCSLHEDNRNSLLVRYRLSFITALSTYHISQINLFKVVLKSLKTQRRPTGDRQPAGHDPILNVPRST